MLPQADPNLNSHELDFHQSLPARPLTKQQVHERQKGEIRRTLQLMTEPDQVVEVRVLGVGGRDNRTASGYFDNPQSLCDAVLPAYAEGAHGVYITLNRVNPILLARAANRMRAPVKQTTADSDIMHRRWLFVDLDPMRPSGISSSDPEHEAALAKAREIRTWLADQSWPEPILADSGNGAHLLYRIDLPNDEPTTALLLQVLEAIALERNDPRVVVDTSTHNAGRLCKLYGTKVRKGDDTPERPHRWSYIVDIPHTVETLTSAALSKIASLRPVLKPEEKPSRGVNSQPLDVEAWLAAHNLSGQRKPWKDGFAWRLVECPFSTDHTDGAYIVQLGNGAIAAGCHHNRCQGKGWADLRELLEGVRVRRDGSWDPNSPTRPEPAPSSLAERTEIVTELIGMDKGTMPPLPPGVGFDPELAAGACPWLDDYVAFSRHWSPRSYDDFHVSVGLWLLSTVAARRIRLGFGGFRFTNLYIALTARTSLYAKSTTARIAVDVLRDTGLTHLLSPDDATPQAFIRSLIREVPAGWEHLPALKQKQLRLRLAFAAQKGWFFDEFGQKVSAMMREGGIMADFRGLLRRFDDCPEQYEYVSIQRGNNLVEEPYLALLANLTPADLQPYAGRRAALWNDGFWARFAFVTPAAGCEPPSGHFPPDERRIPDELIEPLQAWHRRLGVPEVEIRAVLDLDGNPTDRYLVEIAERAPNQCRMGAGVAAAVNRYNDALLDMLHRSGNEDLDGNYARLSEKGLRAAMLLASMENREQIEIRHWARAQEIAEMWRRNLHSLYGQVTDTMAHTQARSMEERILLLLAKKGPLTKREIYKGINGLDSNQAGTILKGMEEAELVVGVPSERSVRYHLVG